MPSFYAHLPSLHDHSIGQTRDRLMQPLAIDYNFMRIFMAPMEGVVDHHLRKIYAAIGGIDYFVTEFVRVCDAVLPEKVFKRYCPELTTPLNAPVRVQLLGSNPAALAENARKVAQMGASGVDLNFGCPAKTVNKNRGGACLLNEPQLLFDIVQAVRGSVASSIPVTAKIRLGYESRSRYVENAIAITEAGAHELVVHARSKVDGYVPPAYWACIGEIRRSVDIPVVANGEIWTVEDYRRCRDESGCADVMLGRGLLARPDLALAIKADAGLSANRSYSWSAISPILLDFHIATLNHYPLKHCGNRLKQWLMYLRRQYPEAEKLFESIKRSRDPAVIAGAMYV